MNKEPNANEKPETLQLVECNLRLFYILGSEGQNQLERHLTEKQKDLVY